MLPKPRPTRRPESEPETLRALATLLPGGSILIVGDERRRSDEILRRVITAFAWALGATIALGVAGGTSCSARNSFTASTSCAAPRKGSWRATGVAGFRSPRSTTTFRLLPGHSIDCSDGSRRFFWRTNTSAPTSPMICESPFRAFCAASKRRGPAKGGPAATAAAIEGASAEVESVLETFDALLRIGQIEAGARRAGFQDPRPRRDCARRGRRVSRDRRRAGRALVVRLDAPLPLRGDRELLTQMIANCLDNALTHTPPGVGIEIEGRLAAFRSDTQRRRSLDRAFLQEDLAKLFEPFFRGDASRGSPGSGLGLSLVAAVAELHGLACSASDNRPGLRISFRKVPLAN